MDKQLFFIFIITIVNTIQVVTQHNENIREVTPTWFKNRKWKWTFILRLPVEVLKPYSNRQLCRSNRIIYNYIACPPFGGLFGGSGVSEEGVGHLKMLPDYMFKYAVFSARKLNNIRLAKMLQFKLPAVSTTSLRIVASVDWTLGVGTHLCHSASAHLCYPAALKHIQALQGQQYVIQTPLGGSV